MFLTEEKIIEIIRSQSNTGSVKIKRDGSLMAKHSESHYETFEGEIDLEREDEIQEIIDQCYLNFEDLGR